jgi:hypothetical protein
MAVLKDISGTVFGRLTVLSRSTESHKHGQAHWVCRCSCGTKTTVAGDMLRRGRSKSCGCLRAEMSADRARTHGLSATTEHKSWRHMLGRCRNKSDRGWPNYGGRGITVCDRWDSFENFMADMGPKPSPAHSIDRIDNDKGYEPGNCRWATSVEQNNNRRSSKVIEHNGIRRSLAQWAEAIGVQAGTIAWRLKSGWPTERAINFQ